VCFRTADSTQTCRLLTPSDTKLSVPTTDLFFANAAGKGYYRTAYPAAVYQQIAAHIETQLHPTERISFLGDEFAQMNTGAATIGDYMDLVSTVKDDQNAPVLGTALKGVYDVYSRIADNQQERDELAAWLRSTFSAQYAKLGPPSPSDSPSIRELRATLFSALGFYAKDPSALAQAHKITEQYLADPTSVDPDLAQTALRIAARIGNAALFDKVQHVYETSTDPELRQGALSLMSEFEDPGLEDRALDYALSGKVRGQDAAFQFAAPMGKNATRDHAWAYIKQHWDAIHPMLTPELGSDLVESTSSFCSAGARDDVEKFFSTHKVASADQAVKHSIERINGCLELRSLQQANLKNWLHDHAPAM
jgi:aminopeptidase N/puromycin-sensitive aminopeptidase